MQCIQTVLCTLLILQSQVPLQAMMQQPERTPEVFKYRKKTRASTSSTDDEEEAAKSKEQREAELRDIGETEQHAEPEDLLSADPGLWPEKLTDSDKASIVRKLATREEKQMPKDSEGKPFPDYLKYTKAANGRENMKRDWLIYSESVNELFCIPCILFFM